MAKKFVLLGNFSNEEIVKVMQKIKEAIDSLRSINLDEIDPTGSLIYSDKYSDIKSLAMDVNLFLGVLYKNAGENKNSIDAFKNVLKYDSKNELSYANLGDIYFKDGNYDVAIENYNYAINVSSDSRRKSNLYNDLGLSYFRKGLTNEAMECFKNSVILNPENKNALYNLGLIYVKSGMKDEIKDDYREFIKQNDGIEILFNISKSIMDIAKQQSDTLSFADFIGESEPVKKVKDLIIKASETDSTVFIDGENIFLNKDFLYMSIVLLNDDIKNKNLNTIECFSILQEEIKSCKSKYDNNDKIKDENTNIKQQS